MAGEDIIAILDLDSAPAMAAIDGVIAGLELIGEAATTAGDSASAGLTSLDDILAAIQAQTDVAAAGFDALDASLSGLASLADDAAFSLDSIDAALSGTAASSASAAAGADAAAGSIGAAGASADAAAGSFDVLSAAEGVASAGADALAAALGVVEAAAAAITVVGVVVAAVSSKMAGDFQQNITKLYTTAGELHANLQMVGDGILQMSSQVGTGALKLSEGMYWIESAGLHGAKALEALRVAAQAAKAENANLDKVSIALAASLNAYAGSGMTDVQVMNTLTAATGQGMMTFEQLAGSLASVLPAAAKFHISLTDVTAALADMTAQGDPAEQAATHLKQVLLALEAPSKIGAAALKSVGLTSTEVADAMKKSLPDALQMITDAVGKKFPEGSSAYNQAIKNIAGGSKQMMGFLELTGQHMDAFTGNVKKISDAVKQGGNDLMGWSDIQQNFNFKLDEAKSAVESLFISIGMKLLPTIGDIIGKIGAAISAFGDWLNKTNALQNGLNWLGSVLGQIGAGFNEVFKPAQQLLPIIKPLTDTFDRATGVFQKTTQATAPLLDTFDRATGVFQKTTQAVKSSENPWKHFFEGVKRVVDFLHNIDWGSIGNGLNKIGSVIATISTALSKVDWGGIFNTIGHAIQNISTALSKVDWATVFTTLWNILKQIGSFIQSTFEPVWKELVTDFGQIKQALQPVMPQLTQFAQVVGIIIVGAIIFVIAVIAGLIKAIASILTGVMRMVTGVIQFFSGLLQAITGIMTLIADLITGKWQKIGADLDNIMQGILQMFIGAFNFLVGLWQATVGAVQALAEGFCQAIIGIFQDLFTILVGHSIIPDMMNSIVNSFRNLPQRALSAVQNLLGMLGNFFSNLAQQAVSWGANIIQGIVSGIGSMFGKVSSKMHDLVGLIGSFLPHSPAKEGELAHLNEYGPALVQGFADGITANVGKIKQAMQQVTTQVSVGLAPGAQNGPASLSPGGSVAPLGGSSALPLLAGILQAIQQQQNKPQGPQTPPTSTMYNNMSLYGVTNIQDLYNSLNSLQGYSYENGLRGAL